jgi:hypothetical protein
MFMKIENYIAKHGLKLWKKLPEPNPDFLPCVFVKRSPDGFPATDEFQIYANSGHTHFVSMNVTQKKFRIIIHDFVEITSEWLDDAQYPELRKP